MKLQINKPFTLELPREGQEDLVIKGTARDLKKSEGKELTAQYKLLEADINKGKDLALDYEIAEGEAKEQLKLQIEQLEQKIESEDILTTITKRKFDLTVKVEDASHMETLRTIANDYGYQLIMDTISEDIEAKKPRG